MSNSRRDAPGPAATLAWLGHPVTVLSLVLLVVNDHVLKARYPGVLTGKLSDVAGLVLAPPVLAAVAVLVFRRLPARLAAGGAIVVTGVGFTVVKISPLAASVASGWWSVLAGPSVVRSDVTDLVALPALGLAGWLAFGVRRPGAMALRRFGVLVMLPAGVLAMAATSAPKYPDAVAVHSWRSMLVAGEGNAYHKTSRGAETWPKTFRPADIWHVSADGGRTWRYLDDAEDKAFDAELPAFEGRRAAPECAPESPTHCYRVVPRRLAVEQSTDGGTSWKVAWEVPEPQRRLLADTYEDLGHPDTYLSSRAVAVAPVAGGHVVVVANGRDGYALRDVTGAWQRIGFGTFVDDGYTLEQPATPLPQAPDNSLSSEIPLGVLASAVVLLVGGWAMAWRRPRWPAVVGTGLAIWGITGALFGALTMRVEDSLISYPAPVFAWLGAATALVGGIGMLVAAGVSGAVPGGRRSLVVALVGLLAVAVGGGCTMLFLAWSAGALEYRTAALLALAGVLVGTVLAGLSGASASRSPDLSRRTARPPSPTSGR